MTGALRFDLGDLILAGGEYDTHNYGVIGEDVDFGEPQPIEVSVATLMGDGDRVDTTRHGNRTIGFRVIIESTDSDGLAQGEAMLDALIGRRTTLTWQPPDGFGAATVFEVETSSKTFLFSDLDEARKAKRRTFRIRLTALPFGRSTDAIVLGSEFVDTDDVTIADACESTAGWTTTGSFAGTWTVDSTAGNFASGTGAVKLVSEPYGSESGVMIGQAQSRTAFAKTLSIDASGGGYYVIAMRPQPGWTFPSNLQTFWLTTSGGGRQQVAPVAAQVGVNGFIRYAFIVPNSSTITQFEAEMWQISDYVPPGGGRPNPGYWFDEIGLASNASNNQMVRSMEISGSVRTEGSFSISALTGLGDVLLYTAPDMDDGFRPDLRRHQTSGSGGTDAAALNGTYVNLNSASVYKAPVSMYRPGTYALMAQVRIESGDQSSPITVSAVVEAGGVEIGPTQTASTTFTVPNLTAYHVVRVGTLELPPTVMDGAANAVVKFTASGAVSASVRLGELLVFPLEDAALTWVTAGALSRVWVDEPTTTRERGAIRVGSDPNRADARYVKPHARGRHLLYPGRMFAYLLTSAAGGADMQVTYFPRWRDNAGL